MAKITVYFSSGMSRTFQYDNINHLNSLIYNNENWIKIYENNMEVLLNKLTMTTIFIEK